MFQPRPISATRLLTPAGLVVLIAWLGFFAQAPERPLAAQAASSPTPLDWTLFSRHCAPPPDSLTLDCGGYGIFYLGYVSGSCAADASGTDVPRIYSKPGADPRLQEADPVPVSTLPRKNVPVPPEGPGMPCEEGSCFVPVTATQNGQPWIAELDWNDWHGWSVGATLTSVSGLPVVLYPLDDPGLQTLLGPGVSDGHVLAQLCAVAADIDSIGGDVPVAINLSFGRYFESTEDPRNGTQCDADTLTCQIGKVLRHLDQRGIALIAAAGNYRQLEFPAILDEVLAAGALDMAAFTWQSALVASWESPRSSRALVPGYGICLPYTNAEGAEALWPAPAGSSYASALFTSWAAEVLLAHPTQHPTSIDWTLSWQEAASCYTLSDLPPATCNPVANEILERLLSYEVETCWHASIPGEALVILAPQSPLIAAEIPMLPSLAEWISPKHNPAPAPNPCVPCVSEGLSIKALAAAPGQDLVLDVSSSSPVMDGFFFAQLLLRIGESYYLLLDRDRDSEGILLDQLQDAEFSSLVIQGLSSVFSRAEQPSLVYTLCESPDDCFWTSVPILIKSLQ